MNAKPTVGRWRKIEALAEALREDDYDADEYQRFAKWAIGPFRDEFVAMTLAELLTDAMNRQLRSYCDFAALDIDELPDDETIEAAEADVSVAARSGRRGELRIEAWVLVKAARKMALDFGGSRRAEMRALIDRAIDLTMVEDGTRAVECFEEDGGKFNDRDADDPEYR